MKKYVWTIFLCMLLTLSGCVNNPTSSNTQHTVQTEKSISVYESTYEQYLKFLELPSIHYLESNTTKYEYSTDKQNNKKIIRKKSDDADSVESVNEGVFRISYTPVYLSLIDFWGDISQVQQYLQSNSISGDVNDVVFLSCYELPCSIGICVESEWYFVTVDEYDEDYQQNIHSNSYVYRLYTHNEILEKYKIVDADLFVNSEKTMSVRMRYDYAEIPMLYLFIHLGANIQWCGDIVTIEYNEKSAKICTATQMIELENKVWCGEESPGGVSCFFVQGTEVYLDTFMAADVLHEFGIEMTWSREESMVCVNIN